MKFCESFEVSSSHDLICKLHSFDISVPPRGQGRKTEHTERWVTFHFLKTISDTSLLSYPLRVKSRDKPDLVLEINTRKPKQIGIEITEAVSQFGAFHDAKITQSDDSTGFHPVPEYKFIGQKLSSKDFKKYAKEIKDRKYYPIMGDAIKLNWKEAILGVVCRKSERFMHSKFKHYPENWLLIYDNWSPSPTDWEVQGITKELSQSLFPKNKQQTFDCVFVLSLETIWEFRDDEIPILHRVTIR